jgi:hypothetical protein
MKQILLLIILVGFNLAYSQTSNIHKKPIDGSIYGGLQCRLDAKLCPQVGQFYCEMVTCSGPVWSPYCQITDVYCRANPQPL